MTEAMRHNEGKPSLGYILSFPNALEGFALVCDYGATKYAHYNYLKGAPLSQYVNCLMRHLLAWHEGNELDDESELPHLAHVVWNALALAEMAETRGDLDDRPHVVLEEAEDEEEGATERIHRWASEPISSLHNLDASKEQAVALSQNRRGKSELFDTLTGWMDEDALQTSATIPDPIIYVASPYSHEHPKVREMRFELVVEYAAYLAKKGHRLFCPISHSHPWTAHDVPQTWEFWERLDTPFLDMCDEIHVLGLPGWASSAGVTAELEHMHAQGKPAYWVDPNNFDNKFELEN